MPDLEKEKQVVLIIEKAQLELKKIIQTGILLDLPKEQLKTMTINLIEEVKVKMRNIETDEQLIQDTEFAIKRSFILWYNNLYAQLKKTQYNATSRIYKGDTQKTKPIIKDNTGGFVITGEELRREGISNIREFQTIYEEGSAGYYYNYTERIKQAMDDLAKQHLTLDNASLRNKAEIKVRYDVINEDLQKLKEKGTKFVVSSAHANASERCSWWQGKIFELDIDIATREMGQYDGVKPQQHIKGYIDGKPYYSLKEACENGFLSYNCQHRLIAYYKGIHIQKYDMVKVEKRRNISQHQRYLERQIRLYKTKLELSVDSAEKKALRKQIKQLKDEYALFCENNNVPRYDWRTKIID
jgi:hypothetical protein